MAPNMFDADGVVWGLRRTYSYLCVLLACMSSLAVWVVLTTYEPFPPLVIPDSPAGLFVLAVTAIPVAVLYGLNRGLVPTYLLSLGPVVATFAYAHYAFTRVIFEFGIETAIEDILLTSVLYWAVGLGLLVAARRLGGGLGVGLGRS